MCPQASQSPLHQNPFAYFEQFTKTPLQGFQGFQGSNMDAIIEMNGITTRLCSELARQNLKMMNELVQCNVEEMQGLSQARGMEEVLSVISQSAAKTSPAVFQHAQRVLDTLLSTASDYNQLIEEGMQKTTKATEKMYKNQQQKFNDSK